MPGRRDLLKGIGAGAAGAAVGVLGNGAASAQTTVLVGELPPRDYVLLSLDRSGSMFGQVRATVDGVNQDYLAKLRAERGPRDLILGIVVWDSNMGKPDVQVVRDFAHIDTIQPISDDDFVPRGNTPLYAAFCDGVARLEKLVRPQDRALLVIQTDGGENASGEVTKETVQNLKSAKEADGNWTFAFMGAGMDAWGGNEAMGVAADSTFNYANNANGTRTAYAATATATANWSNSNVSNLTGNFYTGTVPVDVKWTTTTKWSNSDPDDESD